MTWLQRYRARHYFSDSLWVLPVLATVAAVAAVRVLHWVEKDMEWLSPVHPDTARGVLGMMASSLLTSAVFVCSALLLAVQLVSAQLTPRIISIVFRDRVTRLSLTVFAFMFTFSLASLIRVTSSVPLLTAHISAYGSFVGLAVFFYLIDHLGKVLRPSGALRTVAREGRKVVESVYPHTLADLPEGSRPAAEHLPEGTPAATVRSADDGVVLAFDQEGLLALARRADCVIEMVPQVGDQVYGGDPLFRVFGGAALPESALCESIALGQERTLEQDATFAFRIMVDVALKALSPAINDPTTAVLSLDQIQHLLRIVGNRYLDTGQIRDAAGRLRLVYRTPDWEDFVHLAVTEIRQFGCESIQIARRLRAMLEHLIQVLPEARSVLLRSELALLRRSAERGFADPEDRALAEVRDFQGVGGKHQAPARELDPQGTETP
jgi:uncharacterized membrane protein